MNTVTFTIKALAIIDNLRSVEEVLSHQEFLLLTNIAGLFDRANKSDTGIFFIKAYIYSKAKLCEKQDIVFPALKEYMLNSAIPEEKKQIDMLNKTEKFMEKLTELSLLVAENPELENILDMLATKSKHTSDFNTSPN